MEEEKNNIHLELPVRIRYEALQEFLRKEFIGEIISSETDGKVSEYAEILALSLGKSPRVDFDLALLIRVRTLTSFLKHKIVRIRLHAKLGFNHGLQQISVTEYELEGENNSWFMNKFIQLLGNTVLYNSLVKKMRFDLREFLGTRLDDLNLKLKDQMEIYSGIGASGGLHELSLTEVNPENDAVKVGIRIRASLEIEVRSLDF